MIKFIGYRNYTRLMKHTQYCLFINTSTFYLPQLTAHQSKYSTSWFITSSHWIRVMCSVYRRSYGCFLEVVKSLIIRASSSSQPLDHRLICRLYFWTYHLHFLLIMQKPWIICNCICLSNMLMFSDHIFSYYANMYS